MRFTIKLSTYLFLAGLLSITPVFSFTIKKIGLEKGLSNNYIKSITQDKDAFLWFATEWGLNCFDGNNFKVYKYHPVDSNTINSNGLNKILADKQNNTIWIATQRTGLNAFDCNTQTFRHYPISSDEPSSTKANGITDLCLSKEGNLWIGTYQNGLKKLDISTNTITHYEPSNLPELTNHHIWSVTDDLNGHLYIGHVNGGMSIISLKDYTVKHFSHNPNDPTSLPDNSIFQICIDSKKNVWLATNNGLALYHPGSETFTTFRNDPGNSYSLVNNEVACIREIDNKTLWIGTRRGGISILDIQQNLFSLPEAIHFQNLHASDLSGGLSAPSVSDIFQDSYGNIWIGTYGGGINFIGHQKPFFNTITYSPLKGDTNGLSAKPVRGICYDPQNRLWIATDAGIDLYKDRKKIQSFSKENKKLTDNNLLSALCDSKGNIWFGTIASGVVRYNESGDYFERMQFTNIPWLEQYVNCLYEDSRNNLWIGTNSVIIKYNLNTGKTELLNGDSLGIRNNLIQSIAEDGNGNIWIGTLIDGISIITPEGRFINVLNRSKEFTSNGINHLFRDSENRMYVATRDGLAVFEPTDNYTKFETYNQKDGISDDYIRAIAEGVSDEIWLTTNSGISRFDIKSKKFDNYTHFDNIPLGNFMKASVTKTKDGTIYFGSQNGVCYFYSNHQPEKQYIPPVQITGFKIYESKDLQQDKSTSVPVTSIIELRHNQNTFTVEFNVMDYAFKDQIEYSYFLSDMDDSWYMANGENQLTFRNIPPGKYTFCVKARYRNNEWPEEATSLQIEITPPFWLSWWAKTIYAVLSILIIGLIIRSYKRKLNLENLLYLEKENNRKELELNDEKLRFYTNIAHELRTPLTLIIGPLGDLLADRSMASDHNKKISLIHRSATRLHNLINQILEFRKSETNNRVLCVTYGDLAQLVQETVLKYKTLNRNEKITIDSIIEAKETHLLHDTEVITIILDNLISNALKYTSQGKITITVRNQVEEDKLYTELEVRDTGKGIPAEDQEKIFDRYYQVKSDHPTEGSGIGLSLVKHMVRLHEGSISVISKEGEGSSFCVRIQNEKTYPDALHTEQPKPAIEEEKNSKPLLLVVEDNEEIREYIAHSLEESFHILTAENGQEGIETAIKKMPDLIVSDIMMPVMDGINLCKILKEDVRTCHIPIILLTAKDSLQDKTEGYSVGADSYLTKPFTVQLLHSRISNLLEAREKIARAFANGTKKKTITDTFCQLDAEFIEKTTSLIKGNLEMEQMNIAFLADQLCMSHSTLYRKIKALTGMTANEFIRKVKMQEAEQMILSQKYTISEVAFKVGFNSLTHFRQSFKAEFGMLPSDYIKSGKAP